MRSRFWVTVRHRLSSEDAAVAADMSPPVGTRWFREAGGMTPITQAPLSGRYLSFAEREEIAMLHARGCGVREEGVNFRRLKTWKASKDPDYTAKKSRIEHLYAIADREVTPAADEP
jgi:hypothetical protein